MKKTLLLIMLLSTILTISTAEHGQSNQDKIVTIETETLDLPDSN